MPRPPHRVAAAQPRGPGARLASRQARGEIEETSIHTEISEVGGSHGQDYAIDKRSAQSSMCAKGRLGRIVAAISAADSRVICFGYVEIDTPHTPERKGTC